MTPWGLSAAAVIRYDRGVGEATDRSQESTVNIRRWVVRKARAPRTRYVDRPTVDPFSWRCRCKAKLHCWKISKRLATTFAVALVSSPGDRRRELRLQSAPVCAERGEDAGSTSAQDGRRCGPSPVFTSVHPIHHHAPPALVTILRSRTLVRPQPPSMHPNSPARSLPCTALRCHPPF